MDVLSRYPSPALRRPLERDYLDTLDHFREILTAHAHEAVGYWERLGKIAGIDEWQLRSARVAAYPNRDGVGCSWYMCPFYEQACHVKMFVCAGCGQTQYCGQGCHDR